MVDRQNILENIGLSEKEAKVYLALLELKESTPGALAHKTGLKRPTVYLVLERLQQAGVVSHSLRGSIQHFRALHPRLLLEDQHNRYVRLKAAIPELENLFEKNNRAISRPQVTVFEGTNGLINVMEDSLTAETDLLCWADIGLAVNSCLKDYYPTYINKKVEREIFVRGIFTYDTHAIEFKKRGGKELRDIKIIPHEKFPFKNEIIIYDNKLAIISHQDKIAVIIENKFIAETQRSIFEFAFEYASLLEEATLTDEEKAFLSS